MISAVRLTMISVSLAACKAIVSSGNGIAGHRRGQQTRTVIISAHLTSGVATTRLSLVRSMEVFSVACIEIMLRLKKPLSHSVIERDTILGRCNSVGRFQEAFQKTVRLIRIVNVPA